VARGGWPAPRRLVQLRVGGAGARAVVPTRPPASPAHPGAPPPLARAGDAHKVTIGHNTNLQDGVSVGSLRPGGRATAVGSFVSVGHNAVLHSCTVQDRVLVGMNAVLQDGVTVESGAMVAAGAVVPAGATVPGGELWGGNPARRLRDLKPEERDYLEALPQRYQELAAQHKDALALVRAKMDRLAGGALDAVPTAPAQQP
jgi:carbonic anhydrase/acetyltransferase-like protein (isoleucine patch superfamily)